jgi:serine/threonine protein kinase
MALSPGHRIGSFEVHSALGAGGMGEVYRARDSKLGRDVALKILPTAFVTDPERLARFQREAQVLAALNHTNIAQIYGLEEGAVADGHRALVMELVEGTTLADRSAHGPVPVNEVLAIARQMADALDAAHEKGIVHRDLKPSNVMVTSDGVVKILDFGLASVASEPGRHDINASHSPTLTMAATRAGVILGTAAYMSPEQAAGKVVDKRTDVWSFGVILWEMVVGQRLFDGESISHTLADVLRAEIDFAKLPKNTPSALRELIRRCLDRDVKNRLRDIGEARVAIQRCLTDPTSSHVAPAAVASGGGGLSRFAIAATIAGVALLATAALAFVHFREQSPPVEVVRFQISPPDGTSFANAPVLSPDGRSLVFEAPGPDDRVLLWVRSLDSLVARPLPGTEGVAPGPFWSPDSRYIAFAVNGFPGRIKKIEATGGAVQTLADYTGGFREGDWSPNGVILFGVFPSGLWRVPESGGTPVQVTKVDPARRDVQHAGPAFLPDGETFLYSRASNIPENHGIFRGSVAVAPDQQSTVRLLASNSDPVYVHLPDSRDGLVLYMREGTVLAQPFDGVSTLSGEAAPIAEDVGNLGSFGWYSASSSHLAYRTGRVGPGGVELVWVDRRGTRLAQMGPRLDSSGGGLQIFPDGKRVIVARAEGVASVLGSVPGSRVWTAEISRGIFSRMNPGEGTENSPAVSPDGRVAFTSTAIGAVGDLYWMPATGVGVAEPLLVKSPTVKHPNDFSPDGRFLIFDDHTAQRQDLFILPMDPPPGGGERKPIPFLVTAADETFGQFSPDGRWIAYESDESGRNEVYVQGFAPDTVPAAAVGKWQISTDGGGKPRWRADGKELFYLAPDQKMMAVPVTTGARFEPGVAVPLFQTNVTGFFSYDVSADGRFLLHARSEAARPAASPIVVLLNWRAALER